MALASTARRSKASANDAAAGASVHKSKSVSEVTDPRALRTRDAINSAFVGLLHRRPYASIRVSDITRKAKVGRATFYAHFDSKDALLASQLSGVVMPMIEPVPGADYLVDASRLFVHILSARTIYRSLCGGSSGVVGERIIQDAIEARIAMLIAQRRMAGHAIAAAPFIPRFVAGTLLALVAWALEQQPEPAADDLQATFRILVGRALARLP